MKRNSNYRVETVNEPEDLLKFEGWEIRKVHAGDYFTKSRHRGTVQTDYF